MSTILGLALEGNIPITLYVAFLPTSGWNRESEQNHGSLVITVIYICSSFLHHSLLIQLQYIECLWYSTLSHPVNIIENKVDYCCSRAHILSQSMHLAIRSWPKVSKECGSSHGMHSTEGLQKSKRAKCFLEKMVLLFVTRVSILLNGDSK